MTVHLVKAKWHSAGALCIRFLREIQKYDMQLPSPAFCFAEAFAEQLSPTVASFVADTSAASGRWR
ncbi:hypothetical protein T4E_5935 [Trichinella pseudospiralis]|uniref:Uncharacterized protein n=1 Tax=Trichinella pseudospiralis TaxID=6337 RepID=A0A0V1FLN3_TRIPS|nr:hypothetical protein T4E_5935 [Trichinella pseudospiralis]KRY86878.1 hypothetical protein T4D_16847 [Trichinella pseudospiralis]